MTLVRPTMSEAEIDANWTKLDRRWWRLDLEIAMLGRRPFEPGGLPGLPARIEELRSEQDAIVRQMDELLAGHARRMPAAVAEEQSRRPDYLAKLARVRGRALSAA
jgi:hypothetical protein